MQARWRQWPLGLQKLPETTFGEAVKRLGCWLGEGRWNLPEQVVETWHEAEVEQQPRMLQLGQLKHALQESRRFCHMVLTKSIDELSRAQRCAQDPDPSLLRGASSPPHSLAQLRDTRWASAACPVPAHGLAKVGLYATPDSHRVSDNVVCSSGAVRGSYDIQIVKVSNNQLVGLQERLCLAQGLGEA